VAYAPHHATGQPFVEISQANVGLISRDLLAQDEMRASLLAIPARRLMAMCAEAADIFLQDELPVGADGDLQGPEDYVRQLSATTGMPFAMGRRNMARVASVMQNLPDVLRGLTRGLDLDILDRGFGEVNGQAVSFYPKTRSLGVVLPSNSPGVHGLWVPSIPLKMPLVLRPGSAEPWTPYRMIQALMKAGVPGDAFCYYPSGHGGAGEIVRSCGRSMFFGDLATVGSFAGDPRIELHGPGFSKVVFGADGADRWTEYVEMVAASVADNGGRSCINASGVWTPAHGLELARALAERLAAVVPRAADDPAAEIAPFANPMVAERLSTSIDAGLGEPGARDVSAEVRGGPRLVRHDGSTYLLPTVIHCSSSAHPLANREFLFPYVAVVDLTPGELATLPDCLGQTLVVSAITKDEALVGRLLESDQIGRLNLGPIKTNQITWDQPHEGNLFEHLYGRRAFQKTG